VKHRAPIDLGWVAAAFRYDPTTGEVVGPRNARGSVTKYGYRRFHVGGFCLMAHRIAWALHFNEQPPQFIDHINGDKLDNRAQNLRAASRNENARNRKRHANSTTGVKGVYEDKKTGRFRAQIRVGGVLRNIGHFAEKESARAAYALAAQRMHGDFARAD
jgi:hypothetical protein